MAINLNPGADATLVQAAYAASMANVPHDLSPIYKQMGDSYQVAMQSVGESFSEVAKQIGQIGGIAVKNAIHNANMKARGIYHQGKYGTTIFMDKLRDIKERMKAVSYGWTLNPEKKGEYLALKDEKDRLFAQIEMLGNAETFSDDALINGTFSGNATGKANMIFKAALQKQGEIIEDHDDPTYNGYRVAIDFRKNGDLFFTLMNPQGVAVTHEDADGVLMTDGDKPMTVDINNINNVLIKENLSAKTAINKLFQDEISFGKLHKTKFRTNRFRNDLDGVLSDEETTHYLMHESLGNLEGSFASDLNKQSTFSAELYGSMAQIAVNEGMDIKDTDKVKGLSAGDFANEENYKIVRNAILNKTSKHYDINNTKNIFKEWLVRGGSDQHAYGTSLRTDPKDKDVDYTMQNPFKEGSWIKHDVVIDRADKLKTYEKGRKIQMWDGVDYIVVEKGKKFKDGEGKTYTLQEIWDNNSLPADLLTGRSRF